LIQSYDTTGQVIQEKLILTLTIITPNKKKILKHKSSQQKNNNILDREITLNLHITSLIFHENQNSKFVKITLLRKLDAQAKL